MILILVDKKIIRDALKEDIGRDDITTNCLIDKNKKSKFLLVVNEDAILAGIEVFKQAFLLLDENIKVKSKCADGKRIYKKSIIAEVSGNTRSILKAERVALNFISHLSGIATLTNELVKLINGTGATLLDTRKTTPNLRYFEKEATLSGGAKNHRFNLSDMVLIKDNHIANCKSVKEAILKASHLRKKGVKIEVEIDNANFKDLLLAISCKPNIIMFDNWSIKNLRKAVKLVPSYIKTEASGSINKKNIRAYAESGVNYVSTSYMIRNAKWVDFSLDAVVTTNHFKQL